MADYSKSSDQELVIFLREGKEAAFTEIYKRYFIVLYTHAYKKLRDENEAKDVIHELFTSVWAKREMLQVNTHLAGYLFTAVRNRVFDLFAHEKIRTNYIQSFQQFVVTSNSNATDHLIREKQFAKSIEREIAALPEKMRLIFEMSRKQDLSYREIAKTLQTSENNVSKQVNNAMRILKMRLGTIIFIMISTRLSFFLFNHPHFHF